MKGPVGIITYHAAYNFGSALQAYATQWTVGRLGYQSEIINYRLPNQIHYYGDTLSGRFGKRDSLRRVLCLTELAGRRARSRRYEAFVSEYLTLSGPAIHSFDSLRGAGFAYPILLAGSDQIWNRHCTAEFMTEPPESIRGYFLDFQDGVPCRRVSFSTSIGFMTKDEMREFVPQLSRFESISMREEDGAQLVSSLLGREVHNTVDPTLLLDGGAWRQLATDGGAVGEEGEYVLLYTLAKTNRSLARIQARVKRFAEGMRVVCVSPFTSLRMPGVRMRNDAGPLDFISLVSGARFVVTDSFHGTAFSANLGTPFYSINTGRDQRKMLMLNRLGLSDRIVERYEGLAALGADEVDFSSTQLLLEGLRDESVQYLATALES